ncbi:MAG: MarR family winged helix-turn-helix transcriptional regulator [Coriobacteriia bacterium]
MEHGTEKVYVFGTIFTLSNKLQLLGDRLDPKLTVKQWLFLAGIMKCDHEAPTLSEIAARIGSSRQNVKKMALILEKQGFVNMKKDSLDARMLRVELTDTCRAHLKRREKMETRFIEDLFSGFAPNELSALSNLIKKLEKNANAMGQQ